MSRFTQWLSVAVLALLVTGLGGAAQAKVICKSTRNCTNSQYCYFAPGTCDRRGATGACKAKPRMCTREYRPVCGCDGRTYPTACVAASKGVSVKYTGKCRPVIKDPSRVCGGIAGRRCGRGRYCAMPVGRCRVADATGMCRRRPRACTREYRPVCGCDGKTYPNACVAASRGVNVLYKGKCGRRPAGIGQMCGGIAGITCRRGLYCAMPVGGCRIADGSGKCSRRPRACTREYRPVCGCDGKTYPNACVAASHGVNVAYKGKCRRRSLKQAPR